VIQILCGKFTNTVSAAMKAKGWFELALEVSAVSGFKCSAFQVKRNGVQIFVQSCLITRRQQLNKNQIIDADRRRTGETRYEGPACTGHTGIGLHRGCRRQADLSISRP